MRTLMVTIAAVLVFASVSTLSAQESAEATLNEVEELRDSIKELNSTIAKMSVATQEIALTTSRISVAKNILLLEISQKMVESVVAENEIDACLEKLQSALSSSASNKDLRSKSEECQALVAVQVDNIASLREKLDRLSGGK